MIVINLLNRANKITNCVISDHLKLGTISIRPPVTVIGSNGLFLSLFQAPSVPSLHR